MAQTEVIIQRYWLVEIVPLSSLPSDLQQSQSVDTQTHTRVGEDAKANLSTTVREVHIHVYTYMYCYCGHTDTVWLCVPSGKRMNVGSNPAVGPGFFPARKTGVCYRYGAGVALGLQKQSIHA